MKRSSILAKLKNLHSTTMWKGYLFGYWARSWLGLLERQIRACVERDVKGSTPVWHPQFLSVTCTLWVHSLIKKKWQLFCKLKSCFLTLSSGKWRRYFQWPNPFYVYLHPLGWRWGFTMTIFRIKSLRSILGENAPSFIRVKEV